MNIFYTMKDLYLPKGQDCDASGEDPSGSFLIRNDLKLRDVLDAGNVQPGQRRPLPYWRALNLVP